MRACIRQLARSCAGSEKPQLLRDFRFRRRHIRTKNLKEKNCYVISFRYFLESFHELAPAYAAKR